MYAIYPDIAELKFSEIADELFENPKFGSLLEEKLVTMPKNNSCRHKYPMSINDLLGCFYCLFLNRNSIAKNRGISGDVLKKHGWVNWSNPRVWAVCKDDKKYNTHLERREYFCELLHNPAAIHYIENHPELFKYGDENILLRNPSAGWFMTSQDFDHLEYIIERGAGYEHLFQYLDRTLCKKILVGEIDYPYTLTCLLSNPEASGLVRECFPIMRKKYPFNVETRFRVYLYILKFGHHITLIRENPELLGEDWSYEHLSENPEAIPELEQNPDKICYFILTRNPKAKKLIIKAIEEHTYGVLRQRVIIDNINKNPCMVEYLRLHPKLITAEICKNPGIFFKVAM